MGVYVYCLVEDGVEPPPDLRGIDDSAVRARAAGPFVAWSSALDARPEPSIERVRRHNAVIERATALGAALPVRFGEWAESGMAFERSVVERRETYEAALRRVAHAVEFAVSAVSAAGAIGAAGAAGAAGVAGAASPNADRADSAVDGVEAADGAVEAAAGLAADRSAPDVDDRRDSTGSGRAYMESLARRAAADRERAARRETIVDELRSAVGEFVCDERIRSGSAAGTLVEVAHLVPRREVDAYRRKLYAFKGKFPELRFLLTGPWPPYSFVE